MNLFDIIESENYEIKENVLEGFRLTKVELYNWGTFNKKVWTINLDGKTSLLTGNSGSGKSTIVDAVITLLISPRKKAYNKAADTDSNERDIRSYTLGYYGNEKSYEGRSKPLSLRDYTSYSVVLATFKNEFTDETITLAQVFYYKDKTSLPQRIYVVSKSELFIKEHFSKFGGDMRTLKARLKNQNISVYDTYENYAEMFKSKLGGLNNKALELFCKTISMKEVQKLTDFVRTSMLEPDDIKTRITDLICRYQDLSDAYERVLTDKDQIKLLKPLKEKNEHLNRCKLKLEDIKNAINNLQPWFANINQKLYEKEISLAKNKENNLQAEFDEQNKRLSKIDKDIDNLKMEIYKSDGSLLVSLKNECVTLKETLVETKRKFAKYDEDIRFLNLKSANCLEIFNENIEQIKLISKKDKDRKNEIENCLSENIFQVNSLKTEKNEIDNEVLSLKKRTSNMPAKFVNLRNKICQELGIDNSQIPFLGELIEVKENFLQWEGAIERLLHSFAMSLAVPKTIYSQVSNYINNNHLNLKIVYFAIDTNEKREFNKIINTESVVNKLDIKEQSQFKKWIEFELKTRFDFMCCEGLNDFRRYDYAITKNGQIKSKSRHEKDDRRRIDDRATYVLGFSNERKIELLNEKSTNLKNQLVPLENEIKQYKNEVSTIELRNTAIIRLDNIDDFNIINIKSALENVEVIEKRIFDIEEANDIFKKLQRELELAQQSKKVQSEKVLKINNNIILVKSEISKLENDAGINFKNIDENADPKAFKFLDENFKEINKTKSITLQNTQSLQSKYLSFLNKNKDDFYKEISSVEQYLIRIMASFIKEYPNEGRNMDDRIECLPIFIKLLKTKEDDDLPKHESKFKEDLQSNVIKYIGTFGSALQKSADKIRMKIAQINQSLYKMDYNEGRYIKLETDDNQDFVIKEFRVELKQCTQDTAAGLDNFEIANEKFLQIKDIINKFKGREGTIDSDRKWTEKVTDVRNWFNFSASECTRENDELYEYYTDSGGKSGGQKEKLAYTILAASLAYNYGLTNLSKSETSFRFVIIDEAFLKSSDEYAIYALELFKTLCFQLLIVTPLLKVSTIEPYISSVCYVSNDEISRQSTLRVMPMDEYQQLQN